MKTIEIVQVQAITKQPRTNYLGKHVGVKVKSLETRETFWFNHYEFETKPLSFGAFYKFNSDTDKVIARVQRAA